MATTMANDSETNERSGDDTAAILELAEWRRQVADLYAEVRRRSGDDREAVWDLWRTTRERLFSDHPQSPVPVDRRASFRAHHYPYDPAFRFEVGVEPDVEPAAPSPAAFGGLDLAMATPVSIDLPISAGGTMEMRRIGHVEIPFATGARRLGVFWMAGYAGGLFIPFRDATNGTDTYGAGRYLVDGAKSADLGGDPTRGTLILDFNFAFQPSCAFDPRWACPLAPPENRLDLAIRAGERLPAGA
jgi:uncharacterized protein (DUF1684 family)